MNRKISRLVFAVAGFFMLVSNSCFALGEKSYISQTRQAGDVVLVGANSTASLYVDTGDYASVQRAVGNLQKDIESIGGKKPVITNDALALKGQAVIVGTIGKSKLIDQLIAAHKIDVSGIANQWDAYQLVTVQNPLPDVAQALVIIGANKRGGAYGVYDLSEQIGVSPWYWWADVPLKKKSSIAIRKNTLVQEIPKIKYRGIFLNDEAPALTNWVAKNYGNYNQQFYGKVFELLLRLKANYLWPAMWNNAFNVDDEQNRFLADEVGIIMGTSHHEPMMRAHKEWTAENGKWDYQSNKAKLYPFWEGGVARNKNQESLITIGMRGDGDEPMSESENISLLENIVKDQRQIISKVYAKPATEVPQVWALYKEVQAYYEKGMRVPDDVTLLWCDDNWGNIRRLPKPEERKRAGGAGVYYHFDYVGGPRSYRWINTNSIAKVWEQMDLAYQFDARQIWIVNVGDLKPMEYPIEFFLRMAWNPEKWPKERLPEFGKLWAEREFGAEHAEEIATLMTGYSRHNYRRKPELQDATTYSQLHYDEADRVTAEIRDLRSRAEALYAKMPAEYKDAFFQLVLHPVKASAIVTEMYNMVGKNRLYARQGRSNANDYAAQARALFKADADLQRQYDTELSGGKWQHFMDQTHIGYIHWDQPAANTMPLLYDLQPHNGADMGVAVEDIEPAWPQNAASVWPHQGNYQLARFDPFGKQQRTITVFNKGTKPFKYTAKASAPWIVLSDSSGQVVGSQTIKVSIDWSKLPMGKVEGMVDIKGTGWGSANIKVSALNVAPLPQDFKGFVESDGNVTIEAEHYSNSRNAGQFSWQKIPEHGRHLSSMAVFPRSDRHFTDLSQAPYLEYTAYLYSTGDVSIDSIFAPSLPFAEGPGLRFAIAVDDEKPQVFNIVKDMSLKAWEESVKDEMRKITSRHHIAKAGLHRIRLYSLDAGLTLERIVMNTGGLFASYLGPKESTRK
ncbi:glycosyl hydrolase 115 family protein [Undibacterium sp. CY18W]|uniref:Glycosyl hydrolase 115 family protein n=1 Tax=Undibacterium hunanense TaxID=2762292 RepID=A0ABR6ZTZ5_9BURK|nr:glycosyl hydrolase 115 family protein [Undibacterium hunanense]MBC3919028.1 glycosyl hydrolase 115 family protein [Undibacterium hunanense]